MSRITIEPIRRAKGHSHVRCAHSIARSLAHSFAFQLKGKMFLLIKWTRLFDTVITHCEAIPSQQNPESINQSHFFESGGADREPAFGDDLIEDVQISLSQFAVMLLHLRSTEAASSLRVTSQSAWRRHMRRHHTRRRHMRRRRMRRRLIV